MTHKGMMDSKQKNLSCWAALQTFVGMLFIIIGLVSIYQGYVWNRTIADSIAWPATIAEVSKTEVHYYSGDYGDTYAPVVTYRYVVNGVVYLNDLRLSGGSSKDAEAALVPFPVGTELKVRYNPEDPRTSVTGYDRGGNSPNFWGLLFIGAGFYIVVRPFQRDRRRDPSSSVQVRADRI